MVFCLPFPPVKEGDGAVTNDVGARARQRRERAGGGDADERRRGRHRLLFPFDLPLAWRGRRRRRKVSIDDTKGNCGGREGENIHTIRVGKSLQYSVTNAF
jgi:hypothetical protein